MHVPQYQLTRNCANSPTPAQTVHHSCIAFDHSIDSKVASITGVGYLSVFEDLDGDFNSVDCRTTAPQDSHSGSGGADMC